jgi:ADP-heptose:LPS heptosyltransferase
MLVNCPTIAIFTCIDPALRVMKQQRVIALTPNYHCVPCNKNETCEGRYDCTKMITPEKVLEYYRGIDSVNHRTIITL